MRLIADQVELSYSVDTSIKDAPNHTLATSGWSGGMGAAVVDVLSAAWVGADVVVGASVAGASSTESTVAFDASLDSSLPPPQPATTRVTTLASNTDRRTTERSAQTPRSSAHSVRTNC